MRSQNEHYTDLEDSNSFKELRLLQELEETPEISQRVLSRKLGIALGLTNTMLRNLAKKGFIRASQAGWKRWLYAITPEGFSRKLRLTVTYVMGVLDDYGKVRLVLLQELAPLALHQESRIALYGIGDFAELVFLGLKDIGIEEIDIYSPDFLTTPRFLGMQVRDSGSLQYGYYDKVVIAVLTDPESAVKSLKKQGLPSEELVSFFANGKMNNGA
jgi:DNA-binding MarR family transcriptional regulator